MGPSTGSGPGTIEPERWARQRLVVVRDADGIERRAEPVTVELDIAEGAVEEEGRDLRVAEVSAEAPPREVPCQVLGLTRYHRGVRATIVFEATVPADGERRYLVLHGRPDASGRHYPSTLEVTEHGGAGATIRTPFVHATLDRASGQLATLEPVGVTEVPMEYRERLKLAPGAAHGIPLHWNPDLVPAPPRQSYYNVRRWDPAPGLRRSTGPLLHAVLRHGPMTFPAGPGYEGPGEVPEVLASIGYAFYANQPYVLQTSAITLAADLELHALRNGGELAYGGHPFTDAIWEEPDGRLVTLALDGASTGPAGAMRGGRISPHIAWLAFVSRASGLGLAVIFIEYACLDPRGLGGRAPTHNEGIYLMAAPEGDAWFRAPIWEYALYDRERSPAVHVPEGAVYREANAILPFRFEADDIAHVRGWAARLRRPAQVDYEARDERALRDQPDPGEPARPYEPAAFRRPVSMGAG